MRTKNIIPEFTKDEQDYIKEHANFMEEELLSLNYEINSTHMNIVRWKWECACRQLRKYQRKLSLRL